MAKKKVDKYEQIKKTMFIKTDLSDEEIEQYIKNKENIIKTKYPDWSDEKVMNQLRTSIFTERKRVITDIGGEKFIIQIHWGKQPFDWVAIWKERAMEEFKKNDKKAEKEGFVRIEYDKAGRPKPIPLYWKKKNRLGKDSKMFGSPLPESSYIRTIGGIALRVNKEEEGFKPFEMDLSGKYSDPKSKEFRKIQYGNMLNVSASFVEEKDGVLKLRARSSTFFNDINDDYKLSKEDIDEIYSEINISLANLQSWFEDLFSEFDEEGKVVLKENEWSKEHSRGTHQIRGSECVVVAIEPALPNRSAMVYIDTFDRGLYDEEGKEVDPFLCWWNDEIPLDFGVDSILYLLYESNQNEKKDGNEFTGKMLQITLNAVGCIVIHRTEKESIEIKEDDVEVSDDDFVPEVEEDDDFVFDDEEVDKEEPDEEIEISDGDIDF